MKRFEKIFLDEQQRNQCFDSVIEPLPVRSTSVSCDSPKEQIPTVKVENGQIMHLKPSQLSVMNQVNTIELRARDREIIIDFFLD